MDKIKERTTLALFGFLGVVLATGSEVKAQRKPIDFGATREESPSTCFEVLVLIEKST